MHPPPLIFEDFFNGSVIGYGMINDFRGRVTAQFDFTMQSSWQGNNCIIDERFSYYATGKVQDRQWKVRKLDETHYEGTAHDIVGVARGQSLGNGMQWRYLLDVPVEDKTYRLHFDDWMWAMNDGRVINRSKMKKWGFTVAELTAFMQRV